MRIFICSKLPAYRRKADGFLQLVPETYDEDELVEWEPAPAPISRPEEPGDMGNFSSIQLYFNIVFYSNEIH